MASEHKATTTVQEAGRRGGRATAERHGTDHYKRIGELGGRRVQDLIKLGKQAEANAE